MPWDDGLDWFPTGGDVGYDDPYINWGGGAGGDGSELFGGGSSNWLDNIQQGGGDGAVGGGANTGSGADWLTQLQNYAPGSEGSTNSLLSLLKSMGLLGPGGSMAPLLSLLGSGLGAYNTRQSNGDAVAAIQNASNQSTNAIKEILGPQMAKFDPYINAGQAAIPQIQAMIGKPLAPSMVSHGTPANSTADLAKYLTLAQLARKG